ncbi:MAG: 16S rRNA (cytosine(967)-C(5))-methyltransferase RsmB [Clostridia bacterium]|nr:16S rRNA (cytosine(967)-C(5))-methyltransferase RsmB [Clostridia bacterium]
MIDKSRKAAYEALNDIMKNKSYGNLAVKTAFNNLNLQEKKFASRLVYGTIEKMITLDWIIGNYVQKKSPAALQNLLRLGAYQIYYMDSVPVHAACSTSVDLAKAIGKGGASGFINGVLRNIARGKNTLEFPERDLSVKFSCPEWIINMWIDELGEQQTIKLLSYQDDSGIVIRANRLKGYTDDMLEDELKRRGIQFQKGNIVPHAYRVQAGFEELNEELFADGKIAVQDEGSMLIAQIAVDSKPRYVLDACAAPGGKTAAMADIYNDAEYFATDIHQHRVDIMEKLFERLNVTARVYRFDAAEKPFEPKVDCVLVDAPCSGLGTMFKQPDIKYNKSTEDIAKLAEVQIKILENCAESVIPGGYLIYSTCTISRAENHDVVDKFLKNTKDFEIVVPEEYEKFKDSYDGYGIQLLPHVHGTSGFYIAKMRKIK